MARGVSPDALTSPVVAMLSALRVALWLPLAVWLAFHPLAVARAIGRTIMDPSHVGVETGGLLHAAYSAVPGAAGVERMVSVVTGGAQPAAPYAPERLARAVSDWYELDLAADRADYAPGDVAAVTVSLRARAASAPLPSRYPQVSLLAPDAPQAAPLMAALPAPRLAPCVGRLAVLQRWCMAPGAVAHATIYTPQLSAPGTYVLEVAAADVRARIALRVRPGARAERAVSASAVWRPMLLGGARASVTASVSAPARWPAGSPLPIEVRARAHGTREVDLSDALTGVAVRVLDAAGREVARSAAAGSDLGGVRVGSWVGMPCAGGPLSVCAPPGGGASMPAWWLAPSAGRYVLEVSLTGQPSVRLPVEIVRR
jgi:hypothetical protein